MLNCHLIMWISYCIFSFQRRANFSSERHCNQYILLPLFILRLLIVLLVLRALITDKGLVHCDISYNNILLHEPQDMDNKEEDCHHGLLIDFKYAASLATPQSTSPGQCTVSANFLLLFYNSYSLLGNSSFYGS